MKLWERFLEKLDNEFGKGTIDKWVRSMRIAGFDAGNIYLDSPDAFQIQWFKQYAAALAKTHFLSSSGRPIKIHLRNGQKREKVAEHKPEIEFPPNSLDPEATIETLIPNGDSLAHTLISRLISGELALATFNPITLCGSSGAGKTHLLMAAAHAFTAKGLNVRYVTGETFTEQVVRAFRFGGVAAFRTCYRTLDVLLLDGIDFLSRKWATQEELFHTFNALHTAGKQIIVSSSVLPSALEDIEQRLISRFEWGISAPILPPDLHMLAKMHLKRHTFTADDDVIEFLVKTFPNSVSLIKAIAAIALRSATHTLSIETVSHTVKDLIAAENKVPLTPEIIVRAVARHFDIPEEEITGDRRKQEFAIARQVAMYLCRTRLNMPFTHIGRFFSRDHSTVMSSVKLVERDLEKEKGSLRASLEKIDSLLADLRS